MQWLNENWTWLLLVIAFVAMHLFGHGGHRGHSAHGGRSSRAAAEGCGATKRDDGKDAASSPHSGHGS